MLTYINVPLYICFMFYLPSPERDAIPRTDKGSIKRKVTETKYKVTIDRLYQSFSGATKGDQISSPPAAKTFGSLVQLREFILKTLSDMYRSQYTNADPYFHFEENVSIFSQGVDSLLATQYYYRVLRPTFAELHLPSNILYVYNDINSLSNRIYALYKGESHDDSVHDNVKHAEVLYHKYVEKMNSVELIKEVSRMDATYHKPLYDRNAGEWVILTGVTGSLGNFLVRSLLDNKNVEHIYCLVRASDKSAVHDHLDLSSDEDAYNRLVTSMKDRLINVCDISDKQRLTVWNCNLNEDQLGLSDKRYQELCNNSTAIIHNAWMLDFNKGVMEFDNTCIKPSYTLLRVASTKSIKQFTFVSSITSALNAANSAGVVEEKPVTHQEYGGQLGYGQSKLVTERISIEYAKRFNVPVTIARVGQVAGDSINGVWNQNEHISLMIKGIEVMHAMPDRYMDVDFLPVDVTANTFVHLLTESPPPDATTFNRRVVHMVNPINLPWSRFLQILRSKEIGLEFDMVKPEQWLQLIEKHADPSTNPVIKLKGYFEEIYGYTGQESQQQAAGAGPGQHKPALEVHYDTRETLKLLPCMHYELNSTFWSKVLHVWRDMGFMKK